MLRSEAKGISHKHTKTYKTKQNKARQSKTKQSKTNSKQTSKTNRPTNKQTTNQTNQPTNQQTNKQTNKQTTVTLLCKQHNNMSFDLRDSRLLQQVEDKSHPKLDIMRVWEISARASEGQRTTRGWARCARMSPRPTDSSCAPALENPMGRYPNDRLFRGAWTCENLDPCNGKPTKTKAII